LEADFFNGKGVSILMTPSPTVPSKLLSSLVTTDVNIQFQCFVPAYSLHVTMALLIPGSYGSVLLRD
jgi:hypothetical protein